MSIFVNPAADPLTLIPRRLDKFHGVKQAFSSWCFLEREVAERPNCPEYVISDPTSSLVSVEFNPKDPTVLAGGMYNGRVAWWDIRRRTEGGAVEVTSMEHSHKEPVYQVSSGKSNLWVRLQRHPPVSPVAYAAGNVDKFKVRHRILLCVYRWKAVWQTIPVREPPCSTSPSVPNPQVLWWDTRKMSEPTECLILDVQKATPDPQLSKALGASCLEYEPTIPTRFMVGTEQGRGGLWQSNDMPLFPCPCDLGKVMTCNRKAKSPQEKIMTVFPAHVGPVYAVARNPISLKNFLTVGDWGPKIWSEDVRDSPIIWTGHQPSRLLDGCWSPTRPCTFFTASMDGKMDIWDVLAYHSKPVKSLKVCDEPLRCLRVHESGGIVGCGTDRGAIHLVKLSDNLTKISKNERVLMSGLLDRETHREKLLEQRLKEQRVKEKARSEGAAMGKRSGAEASAGDVPTSRTSRAELKKLEEEYFAMVNKELEKRGTLVNTGLAEAALSDLENYIASNTPADDGQRRQEE
ncbi:unnamed protein product [Cyprideis torosa]|uniref:Uncharacterized protein n=1 Tax=Cyprideis torosa TaxID=163714 RepID=A0A7R8WGZ0_9CRUS|nr:unnamed protein product [Cyprideis torosa]CAG0898753.1 unnamed protein product [Cyprideis torosa]